MANKENEYKKLRSYLNKYIRGKNTEAILRSLAAGPVHLINNIEAVNDSLYIVSAKEKFLDQKLGDRGVVRPPQVGLSDEVFREIGIEITNRKQVRDLVHQLLRILYGEIFTRATSPSSELEYYFLENGDNLIVSFDDSQPIEIAFDESQFENINNASAQEVADAITKLIRKAGKTGAAFVREEDLGNKVVLVSSTDGPSSSVRVLGGKAQNVLKFDQIRPTSSDGTTQWTLTQESGGNIRALWTGGAEPSLGKVRVGDYVNIYGSSFSSQNRGSFTVTSVQGGSVNESYFEYQNPNGIAETVVQGSSDAVLFFFPRKRILTTNNRYAAAFQTSPRTLEIFIPSTTKIVRRNRIGAAHIYDTSTPSFTNQEGPYLYDETLGYTIAEQSSYTLNSLNISSSSVIPVNDASVFPDSSGYIMIGYGTSHQEGPIPYISRPSDQTLRINPSYKFKTKHPAGSDVCLLQALSAPIPNNNGSDIPFFLTDSVAGRIYVEDLIREITAIGIVVVIYVLYPNDIGLGNWGDEENSEKYYIWGTEEDL